MAPVKETKDGTFKTVSKTNKHVQPNATSIIFGLKNLAPDIWKNRQPEEIEAEGKVALDFATHIMNLAKGRDARVLQIEDGQVTDVEAVEVEDV